MTLVPQMAISAEELRRRVMEAIYADAAKLFRCRGNGVARRPTGLRTRETLRTTTSRVACCQRPSDLLCGGGLASRRNRLEWISSQNAELIHRRLSFPQCATPVQLSSRLVGREVATRLNALS